MDRVSVCRTNNCNVGKVRSLFLAPKRKEWPLLHRPQVIVRGLLNSTAEYRKPEAGPRNSASTQLIKYAYNVAKDRAHLAIQIKSPTGYLLIQISTVVIKCFILVDLRHGFNHFNAGSTWFEWLFISFKDKVLPMFLKFTVAYRYLLMSVHHPTKIKTHALFTKITATANLSAKTDQSNEPPFFSATSRIFCNKIFTISSFVPTSSGFASCQRLTVPKL